MNTPTFLKSNIISVIIMLALFLSGCAAIQPDGPGMIDGDVQALGPGSARFVIQQALDGSTGSEIWTSNGFYLFSAPLGQDIGFVEVNTSKTFSMINVCSGNLSNCQTFEGLVAYLAANGWKKVALAPRTFTNGMTYEALVQMANSLFTVLVIPAVAPYSPFQPGIQQ